MDFQTTLQSRHDFYSITGMAAASLVGLLFVGLSLHLRSSHRALSFPHLMLRFGLTALSFAAVIAAGGILVSGRYQTGFTWLVGISVVLLVGALRNSWDLLVTVGAATIDVPASPHISAAPAPSPLGQASSQPRPS